MAHEIPATRSFELDLEPKYKKAPPPPHKTSLQHGLYLLVDKIGCHQYPVSPVEVFQEMRANWQLFAPKWWNTEISFGQVRMGLSAMATQGYLFRFKPYNVSRQKSGGNLYCVGSNAVYQKQYQQLKANNWKTKGMRTPPAAGSAAYKGPIKNFSSNARIRMPGPPKAPRQEGVERRRRQGPPITRVDWRPAPDVPDVVVAHSPPVGGKFEAGEIVWRDPGELKASRWGGDGLFFAVLGFSAGLVAAGVISMLAWLVLGA